MTAELTRVFELAEEALEKREAAFGSRGEYGVADDRKALQAAREANAATARVSASRWNHKPLPSELTACRGNPGVERRVAVFETQNTAHWHKLQWKSLGYHARTQRIHGVGIAVFATWIDAD